MLYGDTLDQHHTGLRQVDNSSMGSVGTHTGLTSHRVDNGSTSQWVEVDNSSMGTHAGSTSVWIEALFDINSTLGCGSEVDNSSMETNGNQNGIGI